MKDLRTPVVTLVPSNHIEFRIIKLLTTIALANSPTTILDASNIMSNQVSQYLNEILILYFVSDLKVGDISCG